MDVVGKPAVRKVVGLAFRPEKPARECGGAELQRALRLGIGGYTPEGVESGQDEAGVKRIGPTVERRFAVGPRPVVALPREHEIYERFRASDQFRPARDAARPDEESSSKDAGVVDRGSVERRVGEANTRLIFGSVQL